MNRTREMIVGFPFFPVTGEVIFLLLPLYDEIHFMTGAVFSMNKPTFVTLSSAGENGIILDGLELRILLLSISLWVVLLSHIEDVLEVQLLLAIKRPFSKETTGVAIRVNTCPPLGGSTALRPQCLRYLPDQSSQMFVDPKTSRGETTNIVVYQKDVLELCPRSFDVFLQVGFVVENPKPKQQIEQGLNMDRINEINDWFWNPV